MPQGSVTVTSAGPAAPLVPEQVLRLPGDEAYSAQAAESVLPLLMPCLAAAGGDDPMRTLLRQNG
jgi:hypothetical protein